MGSNKRGWFIGVLLFATIILLSCVSCLQRKLVDSAKRINEAKAFYSYFYSGLGCSDDCILNNNKKYYLISTYESIEEIRNDVLYYFSPDVAEHFFRSIDDGYIIEMNGRLFIDRDKYDVGGGYYYDTDDFSIISIRFKEATVDYSAHSVVDPTFVTNVSIIYIYSNHRWVIVQYDF